MAEAWENLNHFLPLDQVKRKYIYIYIFFSSKISSANSPSTQTPRPPPSPTLNTPYQPITSSPTPTSHLFKMPDIICLYLPISTNQFTAPQQAKSQKQEPLPKFIGAFLRPMILHAYCNCISVFCMHTKDETLIANKGFLHIPSCYVLYVLYMYSFWIFAIHMYCTSARALSAWYKMSVFVLRRN